MNYEYMYNQYVNMKELIDEIFIFLTSPQEISSKIIVKNSSYSSWFSTFASPDLKKFGTILKVHNLKFE